MSLRLDDNGICTFTVWAPEKESMRLHLPGDGRIIDMKKGEDGYFHAKVSGVEAGTRYYYRPGGGADNLGHSDRDYPDPVSASQPEGVHGPSEVVDHRRYEWQDGDWRGLVFAGLIFYELHVGAFTPEGTFEAIIPRLDDIAATGINAIELMPVAACPGKRNWGYDGVFLYAVHNTYGGPEGLKKLVDACHRRGIAVFLDVVYNHIGREGNILPCFGPYFTDKYQTPWGPALNYDGAWSDGVKEFVLQNVLYWAEHYHIDGLRLDAIHEIFDRNAITLWDLLRDRVKEWEQRSGRRLYLVAESDLNSPRVIRSPEAGGYGFDAQWLDDFHHILYVLLDEKGHQHYQDFGSLEQLAKAYTDGFVHSGEYVRFRRRRHGAPSAGINGSRFIVFNQNHDLPGNRPGGERLSVLVDFGRLKLAAAAVLLAPYVPLLFMGEEYGEDNPFFFFSDYSDAAITSGLREGRKRQFADFNWEESPSDPQEEDVFQRSKLRWDKRREGKHRLLLEWHRELIRLRREHPLLRDLSKNTLRADLLGRRGLSVHRHSAGGLRQLLCLFNFSGGELSHTIFSGEDLSYTVAGEGWKKLLASTDEAWREEKGRQSSLPVRLAIGETLRLPPWSVAVYELTLSTA